MPDLSGAHAAFKKNVTYFRPRRPRRPEKPDFVRACAAGLKVAPEFAAWNGTSSTVTRALRAHRRSPARTRGEHRHPGRCGLGRRPTAAPAAVAPATSARHRAPWLHTRRVHLAKQLIPGHAAGDDRHRPRVRLRQRPPLQRDVQGALLAVRRESCGARSAAGGQWLDLHKGQISCACAFSPPYAWDDTLAFLRAARHRRHREGR